MRLPTKPQKPPLGYQLQRPGLGTELNTRSMQHSICSVPLSPVPGAAGERGVRRRILKRFPYDIVIREAGAQIVIIAFAHHSRKPGYWRERLNT